LQNFKRSKRMEGLARLCQGARRVVDVGCDHAQLCALLTTEGGAEHAYASDIRPGPLENARRTIRTLGLEHKITPVLCDGLDSFGPGDGDTIVIAGMGGDEISAILSRASWVRSPEIRLILQPMTAADRLRRNLVQGGFAICREIVIQDGGKLYTAMETRAGEDESGAADFLWLLSRPLTEDPLWPLYLDKLLTKYRASAQGQQTAGIKGTEEQRALALLQRIWEEQVKE